MGTKCRVHEPRRGDSWRAGCHIVHSCTSAGGTSTLRRGNVICLLGNPRAPGPPHCPLGHVRENLAYTVDAVTDNYRLTLPLTRFVLIAGAILTFLAGIQLFVLSDDTADYFAWTIAAGSTAAVIGAFYWTASLLAFLSWRRPEWANARAGVVGVTFLLWATLLTILIHLGSFHLAGSGMARLSAWSWLILYACYPILVTIALVIQLRATGVDPPRTAPLSTAYRYALGISGFVSVILGVMMLVIPGVVADVSATPLTPLTSRSIGSWLLAMGVIYIAMMLENDAARIRPPAVASVVGAVLLLVVLARYWPQFTWGGVRWSFLLFVAVPAGLGIAGLYSGRNAPQVAVKRQVE